MNKNYMWLISMGEFHDEITYPIGVYNIKKVAIKKIRDNGFKYCKKGSIEGTSLFLNHDIAKYIVLEKIDKDCINVE